MVDALREQLADMNKPLESLWIGKSRTKPKEAYWAKQRKEAILVDLGQMTSEYTAFKRIKSMQELQGNKNLIVLFPFASSFEY